MIQDKEKVEKIYNYLSGLSAMHKSSNNKKYGWSLYNKDNKKLGFSVQKYNWDNMVYNFDLIDVDFNYSDFWFGERDIERIDIRIDIACNFSKLEIKKCQVKDGAELVEFFRKLDEFVERYCNVENKLEQLLLSKIGE